MAGSKKITTHLVVDRYINLEGFKQKQQVMSNGCIEWTGVTNNAGYGFVGFIHKDPKPGQHNHGMMTAHRLAFMLHHNRLPKTRNVNHTCHNRLCVNPAHLVEGTQQQKMAEMRRDGIKMGGTPKGFKRGSYNHKQENHTYKYSEDEIQWIRSAAIIDIATKYNLPYKRAAHKQWGFRRGYAWLPAPVEYERKKRGRPSKATK